MVMMEDRACQPVNRLLSPDDESPRSLPGVRNARCNAAKPSPPRRSGSRRISRAAANGAPRLDKPPARREFERALELRETVHRLFDAEAQDKPPAARDLAALNEARVRCKWRGPCACSAPSCCSTGRNCRWPMSPRARACQPPPLQCRVCRGLQAHAERRPAPALQAGMMAKKRPGMRRAFSATLAALTSCRSASTCHPSRRRCRRPDP